MWPIQTAASFPGENVQARRGGVKPRNETNRQLLDIIVCLIPVAMAGQQHVGMQTGHIPN